ncbi:OmpA family protein [Chitinimonas sp. PSY-7]|uniref:OmpA family protein n=1 Tax=Chitinimonas sp. PSY-7 TaxID=3459088 RepID=UPI00403FEC8B
MIIRRSLFLLGAGLFMAGSLQADPVAAPADNNNQVITVTGAVPDQATKTIILNRLREVYGAERVVDQISVGGVIMPANWAQYVQALISPQLKAVTRGELSVNGNTVNVKGDVSSDANRQQVTSQIASALNPTYVVKSQLRVTMAEQAVLDQALANRIVEFESGSAKITAAGQGILDEMNNALKQFNGRRVEVIGHTDSQGARNSNVVLSKARADAVKAYLVQKGIVADSLIPIGMGPDRPVAPNNTEDGRRRNRRIEFNLSQ